MTPIQFLAHIFGVPSGEQVGFVLSVLVTFALGWTCKVIRDERRAERRQRAFWRGERVRR